MKSPGRCAETSGIRVFLSELGPKEPEEAARHVRELEVTRELFIATAEESASIWKKSMPSAMPFSMSIRCA